jgi:F-type H+-transporting ATPase subunit gamma
MESLPDLRRRIRSVESTRQVTRAMEMISGSRLRRAQQFVKATRPYTDKLHEVISLLASAGDCSHPLFEIREPRRRAIVVMASDKGLCGGFNNAVLDKARELVESEPGGDYVITLGRKCRDRFPLADPELSGDMGSTPDQRKAARLTVRLMGIFSSGEVDSVDLVYNSFRGARPAGPVVESLLPISGACDIQADRLDYIYDPSPEEVLADVFPRYVSSMLLAAMAESLASEHAARLSSMAAASRNALDMIASLVLRRNKLRQSMITREITELVGGSEALSASGSGKVVA